MKDLRLALVLSLVVLAACGSSSQGGGAASGDSGSPSGGPTPDAAGASCPAPLGDAGFSSLETFPVNALCTNRQLTEWITPCQGSIVVLAIQGRDCADYWLFDATTHALQATGHGCNLRAQCTAGIAGFVFPTSCFDGNFSTNVASLCRDGG
jgi:hypothetical protein